MTAIKPPGGPGSAQGPTAPEPTRGTDAPSGPSFQTRVGETQSHPAAAPAAGATGSQAVVADLRAGRITPDQALGKLTDLAVHRSGATPAMRPVIEAQLRELMARDPLVKDAIRQMGAQVPHAPDGESE